MKTCWRRLSLLGLSSAFVGILALPATALAQLSDNDAASMAIAGTFLMVALVFGAAVYIYVALALQTIAKKTGTQNGWLAWIPIANIVVMLDVAKKPMWWILLFFVPLLNIVISIIVWMAIAEARRKPNWWGILTIVPVVNVVVPGYLAWSD